MKNAKKQMTIAIDGYSSCGKSTVAKALADMLGFVFIDTGAMYRGVTLHAIQNGFIDEDGVVIDGLIDELNTISLQFVFHPETKKSRLYLNDKDVEDKIRSPKVAAHVSKVAAIKQVREKLVAQQRKMGEKGGVVMDGRDIGSVVFPKAELKLFLTAKPEIRAQRRLDELHSNGVDISLEEVLHNLQERDLIDSTRIESPLIQTEDAIVIDTSFLTEKEQLTKVVNLIQELEK